MNFKSELDGNLYHIIVRDNTYDPDTVRIEFLDGPLQQYDFGVDISAAIERKERK